MKVEKIGKIEKTDANKKWFDRKGYHMTGQTMTIRFEELSDPTGDSDTFIEYVVFRGSWTRSGTVRDCGNYYIYAGHSSYTRIDKKTHEITRDVDDI